MLELHNVSIYRGILCVAHQINLKCQKGKVYSLLGPNGAGKSSLIGAIFGTIKHTGSITFNGQSLGLTNYMEWNKSIGYMPQDNTVDASLSALEVVLLGLINHLGMYLSDEQVKLGAEIMQELGILHLAQRDIMSLSGGQRQMVLFAQVLLKNPQLLLLDEPVSALDMHHQCVLLDCVKTYTKKHNLTTLMVLHDLSLSAQFADELIVLSNAHVEAQGDPRSVLTQELIERLYHVHVDIFYDKDKLPIIVAKKALKQRSLK